MRRRHILNLGVTAPFLAFTGVHRSTCAAITTRPARIVLGSPPGSSTDLIARLLAEAIRSEFPGGLVVENKAGAAQRLAADVVKTAPPDGTAFLLASDFVMTLYPHSHKKLSYDPVRDFQPVAPIARTAVVFVVGPGVPASVQTPVDFLDWCRANPKLAAFGSPAVGSSFHFAGFMLGRAGGLDLNHIAYNGGAPLLQATAGGQVPGCVISVGLALAMAKASRVRIIGTFGAERDTFIPDVPTMVESGLRDVVADAWVGAFLPAKTPPLLVNQLAAVLNKATAGEWLTEKLQAISMRPITMSPAQLGELMRADLERWGPVVKASGFTADE